MLDQLLETKQAKARKPLGTFISVVLHACVIAAAVRVSQETVIALPKPDEHVVVAPPRPVDPAPVKPVAPTHAAPPTGGPMTPAFTVPVTVPVDIPPVDLTAAPTREDVWATRGTTASSGEPSGGPGAAVDGGAFVAAAVDKVAAALPGSPAPAYPEILKGAGVEGEAVVQFVIDTVGRAEPQSFKLLTATHEAFGTAVRVALPRMRFIPAEFGGRKVRMVVQQTFGFALSR
jgi:protein TonB